MRSLQKLALLSLLLAFVFSAVLPAPAGAIRAACDPPVSCKFDGCAGSVPGLCDIGAFAEIYLSGVYNSRIDFNCDSVIDLADIAEYAICYFGSQ